MFGPVGGMCLCRVIIQDQGAEASGTVTHHKRPEVTAAKVKKTFSGEAWLPYWASTAWGMRCDLKTRPYASAGSTHRSRASSKRLAQGLGSCTFAAGYAQLGTAAVSV